MVDDFQVLRVITQDNSSGRVHLRVEVDGHLMSNEQCNLDEAGGYTVLTSTDDVEPGLLCQLCFPQ